MSHADPTEKWRGDKRRVREAMHAKLKSMAVSADESQRAFANAVMRLVVGRDRKQAEPPPEDAP